MNATDIVTVLIIAAVIALAAVYVYKSKKKGKKCIGCPYCDSCSTKKCGK